MNKVFDWLREQVEGNQTIVFNLGGGSPVQSIDYGKVIGLIDEAEENWESNVCETIPLDKDEFSEMFHKNYVFMGCSKGDDRRAFERCVVEGMVVCPYCCKKIKVKEIQ